jgi:hypothetical protein
MGAFEILGGLIALSIIGIIIWRVVSSLKKEATDAVDIMAGSMSGKELKTYSKSIPRSVNQREGATFTYTGWILVKDFTHNYGRKRLIFSKGDCPGLYLDTTSNSLLLTVKTFGDTQETILISNIPAAKWIHFAIVVDQDSVDFYINGIIRQHHTLLQLPKQNDDPVVMGATAAAGWDGVLANLQYTPRSLSAGEVAAMTTNVPTDDLTIKPSGGQYFDMSWYIGRT